MDAISTSAIELILDYLHHEGVEYIFGVPGGPVTIIYKALAEQDKIQAILATHEEGAAFMADGYARVRRGLGVCCCSTGPGSTNALTGIAASHADSIPVLLLTGQISTAALGKGASQESSPFGIDTIELFKHVTKLSAVIPHEQKVAELTQRAIRLALSGRFGPVHLSIAGDVASHPTSNYLIPSSQYRSQNHSMDLESLSKVAQLLASYRQICILAGHGVYLSDGSEALRELAEQYNIPVATTPKGKGIFPENHPLSLGVFGYSGHPPAEEYIFSDQLEVLVVIGSSLGELQTHAWEPRFMPSKALVQIDLDPEMIGLNYPVTVGVVADARTALLELRKLLPPTLNRTSEASSLNKLKAELPRYYEAHLMDAENSPLYPPRVIRAMQDLLPEDTMLFVDIGNCMTWFLHYYESRRSDSFFVELGLASMGSSIGMAIGGKLAAPHRPAVAVLGDGAFAMNGLEIHTAAEYNIPVIFIVLNDGGFAVVEQGEKLLLGKSVSPSRFKHPLDLCKIAEGLGLKAFRADNSDEFEEVLQECLRLNEPCLIDTQIDSTVIPPTLRMRAETLKHYFAGRTHS